MTTLFQSFLRLALGHDQKPNTGDVPVWTGAGWHPQAPSGGGGGGGAGAVITAGDLSFLGTSANWVWAPISDQTGKELDVTVQEHTDTIVTVRAELYFTSVQSNVSSSGGLGAVTIDLTALMNQGFVFVAASGVRTEAGPDVIFSREDWYPPTYTFVYPVPTVLNASAPDLTVYHQATFAFAKRAAPI